LTAIFYKERITNCLQSQRNSEDGKGEKRSLKSHKGREYNGKTGKHKKTNNGDKTLHRKLSIMQHKPQNKRIYKT